ncbi:uncharacterized protein EV422DRAFT_504533 [Fimicolochytrium jonesii]|uniref:uncharacterized protein n=1 Tax=Fimicolochytrium jonesii TaxID=1396493 RepID=UPI0022FE6C19|nr:uncharacterized protein EV422DRAFT_504533 [Fimicolochytrium jonesii]KAI8824555.1 hypothetical protein EV422DRAFT_504533 [Fimicolochytrium jonesii]
MSSLHTHLNSRFSLPPTPSTPPIPRATLLLAAHRSSTPEACEALAEALPRKLHASRRAFASKEFVNECVALDRLRYKNGNQHRSARYFRKLVMVRRLLRRFFEIDLEALIQKLLDDMHPNKTKRHQGRWEHLPPRANMAYLLLRLASAYRILTQLRPALLTCYTSFRALLTQTFFMPMSMIVMAACARLHLLTGTMMRELEACYNELAGWFGSMPPLPTDPPYAALLPATLSGAALTAPDDHRTDASRPGSQEEGNGAHDQMDVDGGGDAWDVGVLDTHTAALSDAFWNDG